MSLILAAVQQPPVQLSIPALTGNIKHTVDVAFAGFWHMTIAFGFGMLAGASLMGWFRNRGVKGMVTDVKKDVGVIKSKVNAIKKS